MPKTIDGRKLTAKEHRQWKHVYQRTGSAAKATSTVQRSRRGSKQTHSRGR